MGALVGSLFGYDQAGFFVYTMVQTDVEGTPRTFIVEVTDAGFQSTSGTQDTAWSEELNCADPLFKVPQILLGVEFAFVVGGFAYISDPAEVPGNITAQSVQANDGECISGRSDAVGGVVSTVNVGLDALFEPPPFTLGF